MGRYIKVAENRFFTVIPYHVLTAKKLPDKAKILYGLISNLINEEGFCYATNGYFAETLDCSESAISKNITELSDYGFIRVQIDRDEKGTWRKLYLCIEKKEAQKILPGDGKIDDRGLNILPGGVVKNCDTKDNLTNNKLQNTNINQVKESLKLQESEDKVDDSTEKIKSKIGRNLVMSFGLSKDDLTGFFNFVKNYDLKFIDWFLEQLADPKQNNLFRIDNKKAFIIAELKKDSYGKKYAEKLEIERNNYEYEKRKESEKKAKESYERSLIELDKKPEMQELKKFLAENNLNRVFVPEINYESDAYVWFSQFVVEKGIEATKRMIEEDYLKKKNCA